MIFSDEDELRLFQSAGQDRGTRSGQLPTIQRQRVTTALQPLTELVALLGKGVCRAAHKGEQHENPCSDSHSGSRSGVHIAPPGPVLPAPKAKQTTSNTNWKVRK